MTVVTAGELADMRAIADDFFPDTCTIQVPTVTVDATGTVVETFASTYTNVACRIDPASAGDEAVTNMALEGQSTWWLNIPYTQAVADNYRVIVGGVTYYVKSVWTGQSYATIRRALLVRIN